nr:MAG TPA: hypothetical protein [Caudoviricetes sp.]
MNVSNHLHCILNCSPRASSIGVLGCFYYTLFRVRCQRTTVYFFFLLNYSIIFLLFYIAPEKSASPRFHLLL